MAKYQDLDGSDVDFLGLDAYGNPAGMHQLWGSLIGAGVGTGASIAVRALAPAASTFDWAGWSEGIGALAGAAVGGVMVAMPGTRAAGWTAIATALVSNGLRQLERMFSKPSVATAGMGIAVAEQIPGFRGAGFGIPVASNIPGALLNGYGAAGPTLGENPPVNLMASQVSVMGAQGPTLSGLGAHYGATLFGGGR